MNLVNTIRNMYESPEDKQPASPDESSMADGQLEFISYASKEIKDYIKNGMNFPEWFQNKLSKVQRDIESLHSYIEGEEGKAGMNNEEFEVFKESVEGIFSMINEDETYYALDRAKRDFEKAYPGKKWNEAGQDVKDRYMKKQGFETKTVDEAAFWGRDDMVKKMKRDEKKAGMVKLTKQHMQDGKPAGHSGVTIHKSKAQEYIDKGYKIDKDYYKDIKEGMDVMRVAKGIMNAAPKGEMRHVGSTGDGYRVRHSYDKRDTKKNYSVSVSPSQDGKGVSVNGKKFDNHSDAIEHGHRLMSEAALQEISKQKKKEYVNQARMDAMNKDDEATDMQRKIAQTKDTDKKLQYTSMRNKLIRKASQRKQNADYVDDRINEADQKTRDLLDLYAKAFKHVNKTGEIDKELHKKIQDTRKGKKQTNEDVEYDKMAQLDEYGAVIKALGTAARFARNITSTGVNKLANKVADKTSKYVQKPNETVGQYKQRTTPKFAQPQNRVAQPSTMDKIKSKFTKEDVNEAFDPKEDSPFKSRREAEDYYHDHVRSGGHYHTGADLVSKHDEGTDAHHEYHQNKSSEHLEAGANAHHAAEWAQHEGDHAGYKHYSDLQKTHDKIAKKHDDISWGETESHKEKMAKHNAEFQKTMQKLYDIERKKKDQNESVEINEDHFKVGEGVKCLKSGMTGRVVKVDPDMKGAYYTVKRDDGETMKYPPEELKKFDIKEETMKEANNPYGLTRSLLDAVNNVLAAEKTLDPANPKEASKEFKNRKDKDIDNDGKVTNTDKYLHKKRKAITKAMKKDETAMEKNEEAETKKGEQAKSVEDIRKGKGTRKIEPIDTSPSTQKEELQIAEVKASTLGRYIRKATTNLEKNKREKEGTDAYIRRQSEFGDVSKGIKSMSKVYGDAIKKREKGLEKADRALARKDQKEEVEIQEEEKHVGWIANFKGKKLEIKKGEHANDLYGAKQHAVKTMNVPKSQQGLLAVEPAYEEFEVQAETPSLEEAIKMAVMGEAYLPKDFKVSPPDEKKDDAATRYAKRRGAEGDRDAPKKPTDFRTPPPDEMKDRYAKRRSAEMGEEVEEVSEREMTDAEMKKREEIVKSMKKKGADFKKRYGDRAKAVMYATATKMAQKEGFDFIGKEEFNELMEAPMSGASNSTDKNVGDVPKFTDQDIKNFEILRKIEPYKSKAKEFELKPMPKKKTDKLKTIDLDVKF